ncbi:MAG: DNA repair protein RadA [Chlamydiae bacterium]|nr:DNA repair protein RadA [Chlamydiota bacterium]
MAKTKVIWSCQECGHSQTKWSGQCPVCENWNTIQEEKQVKELPSRFHSNPEAKKAVRLADVKINDQERVLSNIKAFDRLLGHGLVAGSLILLGGDPGIGKSTLIMQVTANYVDAGLKVLYICGEESMEQVSLRAQRLSIQAENLLLLGETNIEAIKVQIENIKPDIVIVDSVQVVYKNDVPSLPGSVSQIREAATEMMYIAKNLSISIFMIGHVTKSGEIAGPRVLEHLVDTVLYFEGDRQHHYRILRVVKNRFGPCDEIGIFQMKSSGLQEVENPSEVFLDQRKSTVEGSAIIPTIEGSCPILVEVQALVTSLAYSSPTRKSSGLDTNRLALLIAVLEKRLGYSLMQSDVFVSIAGGMRIREPAIDLGVLMAIASSYRERPLNFSQVFLGEIGLAGDIRRVSNIEKRLKEAMRMGFKDAIIPKRNLKDLSEEILNSIQIHAIEFVDEAIQHCFRD